MTRTRTIPKLGSGEISLASDAAQKVVETHRQLAAFLEPGQTLAQIDTFVAKTLESLGGRSCFRGYKAGKSPPFPSHACLSVNDCVVHGTAGYRTEPLTQGDVLKIDIGILYRGWIGDAAWTYVFGEPEPTIKRLCDAGKESLTRGIKQLRPGNTYMAWAQEVQACVEEEYGFHLIRGLGGHGYGKTLHAPPFISNVVPTFGRSEWPDGYEPCQPGTLVAVEPMLAVSTSEQRHRPKTWPIYTADGSMSVHYEHDVLITDGEPRVLTEGLDEIRDVIV
jgi:methionyl aminopeptidase